MTYSDSSNPLSPSALPYLNSYTYRSIDKSPLSNYVLRHYWTFCASLLPSRLHPNLVTLLGFLSILLNLLLLSFYDSELLGIGPSWLYYSYAAGVWFYSTMDNIDGKQARRTGTSSPLGELFDHGIDSLNCTLASLLEVSAIGVGSGRLGAFTALVPTLAMFFSTWETYHTHTLYLGWFNGPTEGLVIVCVVMILSGWFGVEFFTYRLVDVFGDEVFDVGSMASTNPGELLNFVGNLRLKDLWVPVILGAFFLFHLPGCVVHVVRARRNADLPVLPVFLEWFPFIVFIGSCMAWLGSPWSVVLKDNHLVLFCLTMSLVFGRLTTKIILHHLTRRDFPFWTVMLAPLVGMAFLVNAPAYYSQRIIDDNNELMLLQAYFLFASVVYSRWAYKVITVICQYLDINCLTIKRKPKDKTETETLNGSAKISTREAKKEL